MANAILRSIIRGSHKSGTTLGIQVDTKVSAAGNESAVDATVKIPLAFESDAEAVQWLATAKGEDGLTPLACPWSLPKIRKGAHSFKLSAVMSAPRVHVLFVATSQGTLAFHPSLSSAVVSDHLKALAIDSASIPWLTTELARIKATETPAPAPESTDASKTLGAASKPGKVGKAA